MPCLRTQAPVQTGAILHLTILSTIGSPPVLQQEEPVPELAGGERGRHYRTGTRTPLARVVPWHIRFRGHRPYDSAFRQPWLCVRGARR